MTISTFESLSVELFFEIFAYLSFLDILQSFSSLNTYFKTIVNSGYLWHIHIGDGHMSFSMFSDHCQRILEVIGARVVSLRITLSHTIGGWSLVASVMQRHRTTMLQRLHLIDIKQHEFKKLLRSSLLRHLHTLLIDRISNDMFPRQEVESVDLFEVRNLVLF